MTRQTEVTCLRFGKERKKRQPGCFVCSHCDFWENEIGSGMFNKKKRNSGRCKCEANHKSSMHPPTKPQDFSSMSEKASDWHVSPAEVPKKSSILVKQTKIQKKKNSPWLSLSNFEKKQSPVVQLATRAVHTNKGRKAWWNWWSPEIHSNKI